MPTTACRGDARSRRGARVEPFRWLESGEPRNAPARAFGRVLRLILTGALRSLESQEHHRADRKTREAGCERYAKARVRRLRIELAQHLVGEHPTDKQARGPQGGARPEPAQCYD